MSEATSRAIALLQEALALLNMEAGGSASMPASTFTPTATAPKAAMAPIQMVQDQALMTKLMAVDGWDYKMKFGKRKDYTLFQIAMSDSEKDQGYIGWLAESFGRDDNGNDRDPKYATANAKVRGICEVIAQILATHTSEPVIGAGVPPEAPVDGEIPF